MPVYLFYTRIVLTKTASFKLLKERRINIMLKEQMLITKAKGLGFTNAAIISTEALIYVPEYRKFCEENYCGNYNKVPACPPNCGTAEAMHAKLLSYRKALVLQTEYLALEPTLQCYRKGQREHNELLEKLLSQLSDEKRLVMSAGPWKNYSCISAYCLDAEKMATAANMICWGKDGITRFFSLILF